jgi:hypothetical protein
MSNESHDSNDSYDDSGDWLDWFRRLFDVVEYGTLSEVKRELSYLTGNEINSLTDSQGSTILHRCIIRGWLDGVKLLVDHGANPVQQYIGVDYDEDDSDGSGEDIIPIRLAVRWNRYDIVKYFIRDCGIRVRPVRPKHNTLVPDNPHQDNPHQNNPHQDNNELFKVLVNDAIANMINMYGYQCNCLKNCRYGCCDDSDDCVKMVKLLIDHGADYNACVERTSPLYKSLQKYQWKTSRYLISIGASCLHQCGSNTYIMKPVHKYRTNLPLDIAKYTASSYQLKTATVAMIQMIMCLDTRPDLIKPPKNILKIIYVYIMADDLVVEPVYQIRR